MNQYFQTVSKYWSEPTEKTVTGCLSEPKRNIVTGTMSIGFLKHLNLNQVLSQLQQVTSQLIHPNEVNIANSYHYHGSYGNV